jgi:hypothetical protein
VRQSAKRQATSKQKQKERGRGKEKDIDISIYARSKQEILQHTALHSQLSQRYYQIPSHSQAGATGLAGICVRIDIAVHFLKKVRR